jgi:hypothetical protein
VSAKTTTATTTAPLVVNGGGGMGSSFSFEESVQQLKEKGIYSTGDGERYHKRVKLDLALALFNNSSSEVDVRCKNYENALRILNIDLYRYCCFVRFILTSTYIHEMLC